MHRPPPLTSRLPDSIFLSCTLSQQCNVTTYKYPRNLSIDDIMTLESFSTARNLLAFQHMPYMFHQGTSGDAARICSHTPPFRFLFSCLFSSLDVQVLSWVGFRAEKRLLLPATSIHQTRRFSSPALRFPSTSVVRQLYTHAKYLARSSTIQQGAPTPTLSQNHSKRTYSHISPQKTTPPPQPT